MGGELKGLWNVVLSGYPRSGKTTLARRLVSDYLYLARVSVDDLRAMLFYEAYPCRDEFLVYSLIAELRDMLLKRGYSVIIDSTAPDNITRQFLLTSKVKHVSSLLVVMNVDRSILMQRSIEMFGDAGVLAAYDERWESPFSGITVFEFNSNTPADFDDSYNRLKMLLESEASHKPELQSKLPTLREVRKALQNLLRKR